MSVFQCDICKGQSADERFPQICSICGWEAEDESLLMVIGQTDAYYNAQTTYQGILSNQKQYQTSISSGRAELQKLQREYKQQQEQLEKLETKASELKDVIAKFKKIDNSEQNYIALESEVRRLKSIIPLGLDELKKIAQRRQNHKLYFSLDAAGVQLRLNGGPFNDDLYFVVGFSNKQPMISILEAEFILGFTVCARDLKRLSSSEIMIPWSQLVECPQGSYYLYFTWAYRSTQADTIQLINLDRLKKQEVCQQ